MWQLQIFVSSSCCPADVQHRSSLLVLHTWMHLDAEGCLSGVVGKRVLLLVLLVRDGGHAYGCIPRQRVASCRDGARAVSTFCQLCCRACKCAGHVQSIVQGMLSLGTYAWCGCALHAQQV